MSACGPEDLGKDADAVAGEGTIRFGPRSAKGAHHLLSPPPSLAQIHLTELCVQEPCCPLVLCSACPSPDDGPQQPSKLRICQFHKIADSQPGSSWFALPPSQGHPHQLVPNGAWGGDWPGGMCSPSFGGQRYSLFIFMLWGL